MYPIDTQDGLFHDGNGINELGTVLPASWLNQVQAELIAILTAAGIKPEMATQNQVITAIKMLIASSMPAAATADVAGVTKIIDKLNSDDALAALSARQGKVLNETKLDKNGNAATSAKLQAARTINGVPFDGTQDINATPAGAVQHFAMTSAPVGWLKANGAVVSRTLYANLFAAIGTTFGVGDGKTTFNLPDLRGEFLRGWDDGRGLDSKRIFSSFQSDAVQNWTAGFTYQRATIRHRYEPMEGGFKIKEMSAIGLGQPLDYPAGWSVGFGVLGPGINNVSRTANETRPHNIALLACIKI